MDLCVNGGWNIALSPGRMIESNECIYKGRIFGHCGRVSPKHSQYRCANVLKRNQSIVSVIWNCSLYLTFPFKCLQTHLEWFGQFSEAVIKSLVSYSSSLGSTHGGRGRRRNAKIIAIVVKADTRETAVARVSDTHRRFYRFVILWHWELVQYRW